MNYRCFLYERRLEPAASGGQEWVVRMSQSFQSSCKGLWSVDEGARTYTLKKGERIKGKKPDVDLCALRFCYTSGTFITNGIH